MICRLVEEIESMGTGEGLKIECRKNLGFWFLFGKMGLILKGVLSIAKKEGRSRRNILKIFQNNHSIGVT